MDLRTELNVPKASWTFGLAEGVLTLGSCFAATLGQRLADHKFKTLSNPFGTTYHPFAIDRLLQYALDNTFPPAESFVNRQGAWYNYDMHSSLCAPSADQLTDLIRDRVEQVRRFILEARVLLLTYGTAYTYEHMETGRTVSNCHRMPATLFRRRLASPKEIIRSATDTLRRLATVNPALKIILTVSPVRHLKDTLSGNSVSKSALRLACHHLQESELQVDYFPSYELILDDLRDYRFYQTDLIHPTPLAEEYVWKKFGETYFTSGTREFVAAWDAVRQALSHRANLPGSGEHREFLLNTLAQVKKWEPTVDVREEMEELERRITAIAVH